VPTLSNRYLGRITIEYITSTDCLTHKTGSMGHESCRTRQSAGGPTD